MRPINSYVEKGQTGSNKMPDRNIAFLASLDFASWKSMDVVDALRDLGYSGVEWTLSHFNPRTMSSIELRELIKGTSARGLQTTEIAVHQDFVTFDAAVRRERIDLAAECIRAAADCGVEIVSLFTGPVLWDPSAPVLGRDISEGTAWEMVLEAFDRLVHLAERHHIALAVEAMFGMLCRDYYTTRPLIDAYNSIQLGVNLDPSHYALYRDDVPWTIRQWGDKIKHVHLKDVIGLPGTIGESFMFPLLGEGMIDWTAFAAALDEVGYNGWMSVDFESLKYYNDVLGGDPVKAARISMESVKKLL